MLCDHVSSTSGHVDSSLSNATRIANQEAAAIVRHFVDPVVNDEMVEAWFSRHGGSVDELSEQALADIAPWLPIIAVAANDRSIGVLDFLWSI